MPEESDKKKRLWQVDPMMYDSSRRASILERRVIPPLRQVGKFVLIALALTYPIYLIYVGLAFGGIAFWTFFAGSITVAGIVISRMGYESNFRNWDLGFRRMAALLAGFLIAMGFYVALIYFRTWQVPTGVVLVSLGLYFAIKHVRS